MIILHILHILAPPTCLFQDKSLSCSAEIKLSGFVKKSTFFFSSFLCIVLAFEAWYCKLRLLEAPKMLHKVEHSFRKQRLCYQ